MIEYAAIIDFETSGLNHASDFPVEFAALIFDTQKLRYVKSFEGFFPFEGEPQTMAMIEDLCGIEQKYIFDYQDRGVQFLQFVNLLVNGRIKALVAYNAEFDRGFFHRAMALMNQNELLSQITAKQIPMICAMNDVPYPEKWRGGSLELVAAKHEILNMFAHRGIGDCFTTLKILQKYSWNQIMECYMEPSVKIVANTSYAMRELPKQAGFRWNPDYKEWWKIVKKNKLDENMNLGFSTFIDQEYPRLTL